jgi:SAM-dependent methyltransferase
MTILPPEHPQPPPLEPGEIHQARHVAESFGSDPGRYDRTRPHYPDALVQQVVAASPGPDVLDVGTGTGIAARQFQAAGCRVLGVEPDPRMAEFARQTGVETEVAKFEDWDGAGRQFDSVIAGQAWHWVDPVAGAARAARALRPDGRLAVFWYVFQPPADLSDAFSAVYRRVLPDTPLGRGILPGLDTYSAFFTRAADGMQQSGAFGEPAQWRYDWDHHHTKGDWLDLVPSFGGHSLFPPEQLNELLTGLGAAIDAVGGGFSTHYTAVAVTAVRGGQAPDRPRAPGDPSA